MTDTLKPAAWDESAARREYVDMLKGEIEAQRLRLSDAQAALAKKDKRIAELEIDKQAMISAIKHYSGSDDVVFGVQRLVSRATAAEAEAARLRSLLAEAREVVKPFATGLAKTTHTNQCRHHGGHDCDCGKDDYLRAALALAEKLEKEKADE